MRRFRSNFGQSRPKSENRHGIRGWTSNLGQGSGRQKAISSNPERFEQPPRISSKPSEFRATRPNFEYSIRDKREFRATHPNFEQTIRISSKPRRSFEHFERFERDPPETPDGLEMAPNSESGDFGPKKHIQDAFGTFGRYPAICGAFQERSMYSTGISDSLGPFLQHTWNEARSSAA